GCLPQRLAYLPRAESAQPNSAPIAAPVPSLKTSRKPAKNLDPQNAQKRHGTRGTSVPTDAKCNETKTKHRPGMSANERPATSQRCHGQGRVCYMLGARDDGCESAPYSTVVGLTLNLIPLGLLA